MHSKTLVTCALTLPYAALGQLDWFSGVTRDVLHDTTANTLSSRDSAILCGSQNGNVSCPVGFCCSQNGQCGTARVYCDAPYCQFEFGPACDANETPDGFNTSSVPRPQVGSVPYGGTGVRNCTVPGTVALTFDDGPYIYTADLLDVLKAANVPATFFITGNNFNKHQINNASTPYPDIIRRMHHEGHQIGSHTWSHQNLENITHSERIDQMVKNEIAITDILGFFPTYMRPPFDQCKSGASGCQTDMKSLGYHLVNYNLDTEDYVDDTPALIHISKDNVSSIVGASDPTKQAFIVYAHDIYDTTVHNLTLSVIQTVRLKGYRFVTVGECLNDPRDNWYRNVTTGDAVTDAVAFATSNVAADNSTSTSSSSTSSSSASSSPKSNAGSPIMGQWSLSVVMTVVLAAFAFL